MTPNLDPKPNTQTPDLSGTLIILLLSAAVTIFLRWISNQTIGGEVFKTLPDWVIGATRGIWTSVSTGAAGIGLAVAKAFGKESRHRPNYLAYILVTTICMFVPITVVAAIHHFTHPIKIREFAKVSPNVYRIDPHSNKETEFELNNSALSPSIEYRVRGAFHVEGNEVKVHVSSVDVKIAPYVPGPGPIRLEQLSFWGAYWKQVGDEDQKVQTSNVKEPSASLDLDMLVKPNAKRHFGTADLEFQLPANEDLSRLWLSGGIRTDIGGYTPFQWN